jgi:hypothetical protein
MSAIKKELHELRTLYRFHPKVRDVIVEGRDDAALLKWYLRSIGDLDTQVYAVDDRVDVPVEAIRSVHDDVNKRGMVVGLASLAETWQLEHPSLTCVIDSDFDLLRTEAPSYTHLVRTDYASMEIYSLQEKPLSKFLLTIAKSDIEAPALVSMLKPAWATIYAVRFVLKTHCQGIGLVRAFAGKCFNTAGDVVAGARELLRASDSSIHGSTLETLLELHAEYLEKIPADDLNGIRGHDVAPLLARFLGLKNDLAKDDILERLMRVSLEVADLHDHRLFETIRSRVRLS